MPKLYEFSRASEATFQRIIELSKLKTTRNKWSDRFSRKSLLDGHDHIKENSIQQTATNVAEVQSCQGDVNNYTECDSLKTAHYEKYKELLESNPTSISYILQQSINNENILLNLASNISDINVEKLCQYIFESNLEPILIEQFIQSFLPTYFKHQNTWLSVDILAKVFKRFPLQFERLLQAIVQDCEINTTILQEFITTLGINEQTNLWKCIINLDISVDNLIRNMFTICYLYKNCSIDKEIQSFILTYLIDASDKCINEKQYGRLLLLFLQNKRNDEKLDFLQKIVDTHRSPFKRPCLNALKEIIEKYS